MEDPDSLPSIEANHVLFGPKKRQGVALARLFFLLNQAEDENARHFALRVGQFRPFVAYRIFLVAFCQGMLGLNNFLPTNGIFVLNH